MCFLRRSHLFLLLFFVAAVERSQAFSLYGFTWGFGRDVPMHLNLEGPNFVLQDGNTSWAEVARDAMNIWNAQINTARFVPADPVSSYFGDAINTVQFSDGFYGQSFGSNVLAVTLTTRIFFNPSSISEAEVFFNKAKRFDSYSGPLQTDQAGPVFDFHRVALHEFGHCLGLLHPDQSGQTVEAIMNSVVSDLDHLAEDDIAGIRSLYWRQLFGQAGSATVAIGYSFFYQLFADNNPTSFSAVGLPPGLTINTVTGVISGTPLRSGIYDVTFTASGPATTSSGTLRIEIARPLITSPNPFVCHVGEPFEYRIAASNQPLSYDATNLPPGLVVDRQTGIISGIPTVAGGWWVALTAKGVYEDAVSSLAVNIYVPFSPVDPPQAELSLGGLSHLLADPNRPRIYGLTNDAFVVIDSETGNVIKTIPSTYPLGLSFSRDGRTLWLGRAFLPSVGRIDLETLETLAEMPTDGVMSSVYEGLGHRLYGTAGGDVVQFDANTGATQQRFWPNYHVLGTVIALSHDGRRLYVGDASRPPGSTVFFQAAVTSYDVSGEVPVMLQRVELPGPNIAFLQVSPDDASLIVAPGTDALGLRDLHRTYCLSTQDLNVTKGTFAYQGSPGPVTISPDNKLVFQAVYIGDLGGSIQSSLEIFDATSFQHRRSVIMGNRPDISAYMSEAVLDRTGSRIFVSVLLDTSRTLVYTSELPPLPVIPPRSLLNLSTRLKTQQGDGVLVGGFIISGTAPKKVILRALGPSLPLSGNLTDPVLELHASDGTILTANDNWNEHRQDVLNTGIPPINDYEAAIVATLSPGPYTAILRGTAGTSGIAVVEIYDLSPGSASKLANISSRGKIESNDNVMIGGFILGGDQSTVVVVRALGPSLAKAGVGNALSDPMLEVYDANGVFLAQNDNWRPAQEAELTASGLAPKDDRESALYLQMNPGAYTVIVRGKDNTAGVGLVEVYNLDANHAANPVSK